MINIRVSVPDDVYGIREVQKKTWLATYPNNENGITNEDIESVFELDQTAEGKQKMEKRKERYENKSVRTWVAEDKDNIVGFCVTIKEENNSRVGAIYVLPSRQKEGIGSMLLKEALEWLGNKEDIYVNVVSYNNNAISFYKKFGFVETGKNGILDIAAELPTGKYLPETELKKSFT